MNDSAAGVAWSHPGGGSSPLRWIDGGVFFNTYVLCCFEAIGVSMNMSLNCFLSSCHFIFTCSSLRNTLLSLFPTVVVVLIFYLSNCKSTKTCHLSRQTLRKTYWRTLKFLHIQKNVFFLQNMGPLN